MAAGEGNYGFRMLPLVGFAYSIGWPRNHGQMSSIN